MGFRLPSFLSPTRRAMAVFLRRLPCHLREDYGHLGPYTPEQIESSLRRHRIGSPKQAPYAVAMFSDTPLSGPDAAPWAQLRREVGAAFFSGDDAYLYSDVVTLIRCHGGFEPYSDPGSGAAEGGHHAHHGDAGAGHH